MASPELEDQLQRLTVNEGYDAECLPFRPPPGLQRENEFDKIPRYLFRVFTPRSQGITTLSWVKSMEARRNTADSKVDIFAQADSREIAQMINRHLRWWEGKGDNLVSWTSSLLFALVYIFYLRANERDGSAFEQIRMCIIDTSTFPEGVFLRDLDLVRFYRAYDEGYKSLSDFEGLRLRKHESFSGYYYFGEYLSQGALKIEGKCQIVSAQTLMDRGLFRIRPEFEHFAGWTPRAKPPWANVVIELRESFYISKTERSGISEEGLQAALHISRLFEPPWRLVMAANLIALAPPRMDDGRFLAFLRPDAIAEFERTPRPTLRRMTVAHDTLPEVQEAGVIMQSAYRDYCLCKLKETFGKAEVSLRHGIIILLNGEVNRQDLLQADQGFTCVDVDLGDILRKLDTIRFLCDRLKSEMKL